MRKGKGRFFDNYLELGPDMLTAEDAFEIAENAVGADFREQVQNECITYISAQTDGNYDGWKIDYSSELPLLIIVVDEESGEHEIVEE